MNPLQNRRGICGFGIDSICLKPIPFVCRLPCVCAVDPERKQDCKQAMGSYFFFYNIIILWVVFLAYKATQEIYVGNRNRLC